MGFLEYNEYSGDGVGYGYGNDYCDGYGYGDGDGYGYGYGVGYGYCDGNGDGDGNGFGYGYGYGDGDGYFDGYGYGDGYFDGYGDGDGYGVGYGDGDGAFWMKKLNFLNLQKPNSIIAFCKSNKDGTPSNGGSGTICKPGVLHEISGPLQICTENALHATLQPNKWAGDKIWVCAMHKPCVFDGDKIGSLKREILFELKD